MAQKTLNLTGRAVTGTLSDLGAMARTYPRATLGLSGGLGAGGMVVAEDVKRGLQGLSPQHLALRRMARARGIEVPPVPGQFRDRFELAKGLVGSS